MKRRLTPDDEQFLRQLVSEYAAKTTNAIAWGFMLGAHAMVAAYPDAAKQFGRLASGIADQAKDIR